MLIKLVVVLTMVVAVTSVEDCRTMNGIKYFSIRHVCGKTYYTFLTSSAEGITCISHTATCKNSRSVNILMNFYLNGVLNHTMTLIARDVAPGVIWRVSSEKPLVRQPRQIWYSYAENTNGQMKACYALCGDDSPIPFRKSIVANFHNPDLSDEVELMKGVVSQDGNLQYLPNMCFPKSK